MGTFQNRGRRERACLLETLCSFLFSLQGFLIPFSGHKGSVERWGYLQFHHFYYYQFSCTGRGRNKKQTNQKRKLAILWPSINDKTGLSLLQHLMGLFTTLCLYCVYGHNPASRQRPCCCCPGPALPGAWEKRGSSPWAGEDSSQFAAQLLYGQFTVGRKTQVKVSSAIPSSATNFAVRRR